MELLQSELEALRTVAERLVAGLRVGDEHIMRLVDVVVAHEAAAGVTSESQKAVVEGNINVDLHSVAGVNITDTPAGPVETELEPDLVLPREPAGTPVVEETTGADPVSEEVVTEAPVASEAVVEASN